MYSGSRQATCYTLTKFGTWLEGKSRAYPQRFFFFFEINNLLCGAHRQSTVAKRVQGTTTLQCTLEMHLLHYLSTRQRSASTERKE